MDLKAALTPQVSLTNKKTEKKEAPFQKKTLFRFSKNVRLGIDPRVRPGPSRGENAGLAAWICYAAGLAAVCESGLPRGE